MEGEKPKSRKENRKNNPSSEMDVFGKPKRDQGEGAGRKLTTNGTGADVWKSEMKLTDPIVRKVSKRGGRYWINVTTRALRLRKRLG